MKPCNITSRFLIITRFSESNKTTAHIKSVQYHVSFLRRVLFHSSQLLLSNHKKIKGKECIHVTNSNCVKLHDFTQYFQQKWWACRTNHPILLSLDLLTRDIVITTKNSLTTVTMVIYLISCLYFTSISIC